MLISEYLLVLQINTPEFDSMNNIIKTMGFIVYSGFGSKHFVFILYSGK